MEVAAFGKAAQRQHRPDRTDPWNTVPRNMDIYPNCPRRPPNSAEDGSRAGIAPAGGGGITGRAVLARAGAAGDRVVEQPGLLRAACTTRSLRETIAHKLHTCPLRFFASSCGVTWNGLGNRSRRPTTLRARTRAAALCAESP